MKLQILLYKLCTITISVSASMKPTNIKLIHTYKLLNTCYINYVLSLYKYLLL